MKPKSRLGKAASIFAKTTGGSAAKKAATAAAAPPPTGSSVDNKLTVILPPDQVAFLDRLCLDIRDKTGAKMKRTEVIRGLVAGIRASGLDLTAYGTEADIAAAIQKGLKG